MGDISKHQGLKSHSVLPPALQFLSLESTLLAKSRGGESAVIPVGVWYL